MLLRVQPVAEARPVSVFAKTPQQEVHPEAPPLTIAVAPTAVEVGSGVRVGGSGQGPRTAGQRAGATVQHAGPKVGRNEPCPCGSGKKHKKCHGQ